MSHLTGAFAKLQRLRSMRPAEVSHRIVERLRTEVDRAVLAAGRGPRNVESGFREYLSGAPLRRFYRGARETAATLPPQLEPSIIGRAVDEAERLLLHRVELLGFGEVDLGAAIDWHRDPVTGAVWEK